MKQSPELKAAEKNMRPGVITLEGFKGNDRRPLRAVIEEDNIKVGALGLTHKLIVERLKYFTDIAHRNLERPVVIDDIYEVRMIEGQGLLPCPWPHPGLFHKTVIYLKRLDTGEDIKWTELNIHMIESHGFYEGRGSMFRLSAETLKRIFKLSEASIT